MATLTVSLSDDLRAFASDQATAGGFESIEDYVLSLIRERQARRSLRAMLLKGAESGPGVDADDAYFQSRRDHVRASRTAAE